MAGLAWLGQHQWRGRAMLGAPSKTSATILILCFCKFLAMASVAVTLQIQTLSGSNHQELTPALSAYTSPSLRIPQPERGSFFLPGTYRHLSCSREGAQMKTSQWYLPVSSSSVLLQPKHRQTRTAPARLSLSLRAEQHKADLPMICDGGHHHKGRPRCWLRIWFLHRQPSKQRRCGPRPALHRCYYRGLGDSRRLICCYQVAGHLHQLLLNAFQVSRAQ